MPTGIQKGDHRDAGIFALSLRAGGGCRSTRIVPRLLYNDVPEIRPGHGLNYLAYNGGAGDGDCFMPIGHSTIRGELVVLILDFGLAIIN